MTDHRHPVPPRGAKPWQSKLNPCLELIRQWRRAGLSYAAIAERLAGEHGIRMTRSAIHAFVRARARRKRGYELPPEESGRGMVSESKPMPSKQMPAGTVRRYTDAAGRVVAPPPPPFDPESL